MKRLLAVLCFSPLAAVSQVYQPPDLGKVMQQAEEIRALRAETDLAAARAAEIRERTAREEERRARQDRPASESESINASDIRFLKFLNQTTACQRVYPTEEERSVCIEKLKITDPDFARTWAEAMTPGAETPELHMHRAELLKTFLSANQAAPAEK